MEDSWTDSWTLDITEVQHASCRPEDVMDQVLDPRSWPAWQSEILDAQGPVPLRDGAVVRGRARLLGFRVQGHSTTVEADETTFEEDVIVGVRMRIRYAVKPSAGGVEITRRLRADLPRGVAGHLLSVFLGFRLRRMQRDVVRGLARRSERP